MIDRRIVRLGIGAALVAVAAVTWVESSRARARLGAELPQLRASIAALQAQADEVKRLRAVPVAASPAGAQAQPLVTLATNGGGLAGAQVLVLDNRRVKVTGADVAFGALLEWLQNAQATHHMQVESARLEALPATGRVRAELTLTRG